ncbi:hypothetical protein Sbal223_4360 (plasmid) [Shewanella baltica OS223]|uniref:hypothetical protein n=1 Tax=Shewanella baltica TaxID=62322 RepID=UPI0001532032|nr:hypothetical protein [Shewanella baltica]ACK48820.1 hypothetical protein Sbal223_4360 [Shewanella baltica OS223]
MDITGLSEEEKGKLAYFYRLVMSYSDFKHAHRCAMYSLEQHEQLEKKGGDDLILRALYCSMVVSYSRPFNSYGKSNIGEIPPLKNEIESAFTEQELKAHKYLRWCRNKYLAHSDAKEIALTPFVTSDLSNKLVMPSKVDALAPFTREYTELVLELLEKTYRWCVEERHRIEPEIVAWLPIEQWGAEG